MFRSTRLVVKVNHKNKIETQWEEFRQDRFYPAGDKQEFNSNEDLQKFLDDNVDLNEVFVLNLNKDRIFINFAEIASCGHRYYW